MKLIDWNLVPWGIGTNKGLWAGENMVIVSNYCKEFVQPSELRVATNQTWVRCYTEVPAFPGLNVEIRAPAFPGDATQYRVIGVDRQGGWTDNPQESTSDD